MRRLIVVIMVLSLALSLCACGSAPVAEPSVGDQMYEKYGDIIGALEEERYDDAIDAISAMKPAPEIEEVTITKDNFLDYYEVVLQEANNEKDAAGNIVTLYLYPQSDLVYGLKEEYKDRLVWEGSHVEIGVTGTHNLRKLESVDWQSGEYVLSDVLYDDVRQSVWEQFSQSSIYSEYFSTTANGTDIIYVNSMDFLFGAVYWHPQFGSWWHVDITPDVMDNDIYVPVLDDVEIVRAEGTLTFQG